MLALSLLKLHSEVFDTDILHDSLFLACPRNRQLSVRVDELYHSCRAHEQGHIRITTQHLRPGRNIPHIPQDSRPKPYPIERRLIRISRDQIRRRTRVKRPSLLSRRLGSHDLKIMCIDQSLERRLLVIRENFSSLLWRRL